MNIGDKVIYDGVEYFIEKIYQEGVYLIGNEDAFVDLVSEDQLEKKDKG